MRKPNYNMERKDRERARQAKAAAKTEKRATKGAEDRDAIVSTARDETHSQEGGTVKPEG